ncbi:hypothetical protein [Bradyrhizobium sp. 45]|nr:hypothetical protein [Bradyrhizobium sp. 45]
MHVAILQPGRLSRVVDARVERAHAADRVANKPVAGRKLAIGRYPR